MNKKNINPALQEESIGEPAVIITPRENESLFRWIKSTGRFLPPTSDSFDDDHKTDELDHILSEDEEKNEDE